MLALLRADDASCSEALAGVRQPFEDAYAVIAAGLRDGRILCAHPQEAVGIDVSDRPWFARVVETGEFVVSGYQVSRTSGAGDIVVARPVPDSANGSQLYVGAGIRLDYLGRYLAGAANEAWGDTLILDETGRIVASTTPALAPGDQVNAPEAERLVTATLGGTRRDVFMREIEIGGTAFRVLALAPGSGVLSPVDKVGLTLILAAIYVGIGMALYVARVLRRDVTDPLDELRRMAKRIAAGEVATVTRIATAPPEVQETLTAFNEMARKLEYRSQELDRASRMARLATWSMRPGSDTIVLSDHIREVLGFPQNRVALAGVEERILPDDLSEFRTGLRRGVEGGETVEFEFRALTAGKETRTFLARTGPLGAGSEDSAQEVSGIVQDITDLRRREEALDRSKGLLRTAGKAAHLIGWRYDPQTSEFLEYTGVDSTEVSTADEALENFGGESHARMARSFWACVASGIPFDEVVEQKRGDETRWVRVIGEAERDAQGRIKVVHGALQDIDELVRARQTSSEMEALLREIVDFLGDGFFVQDAGGRVQYMNWRAQVILGLAERRSLIGHVASDEVAPELGDALRELTRAAEAESTSQSADVLLEAQGTCLELNVHPSPSGVAVHVRDVTHERERQERLRLLDTAVSRLNDMIVITKADPIEGPHGPEIVYVNEAFVEMTGYGRDEVIGKTPRLLQGVGTEREKLADIRTALMADRPIRTELTNYRKDGSEITLDIDITPIFDGDGTCSHFVAVQRDTTERRAAEERLRAREEQFRLVSKASNDVIWDWDLKTGIIWHSENYRDLFGRPPAEECTIEADLERIHPEDRLDFSRSLHEAFRSGAESWSNEYRVADAEGEFLTCIDRGFILREDADGKPRRMVGALTDVSQMRNLDEQLHQARKLEAVGQLTGGVAHDFNNLLTIILGNCDLLLEEIESSGDEALKPRLISIADAAERGARLSSSLLSYSRRQQLRPRAIDCSRLIRDSEGLFLQAIPESVKLDYELTDDPAIALVDPDKLQSALLNLVINAAAAIETKGRIVIRTSIEQDPGTVANLPRCPMGDYVTIEVIDDGPGMTPEVAERAFEPFFTTKPVGVGTGLGLSSVYGLVRQSGGNITLDTAPGEGTHVTLCLPVFDGDAEAVEAPPKADDRGSLTDGGRHILIVEDDEDVRAFASRCLTRLGYIVREAETGDAAIEVLQQDDPFDLLLTDVVMPGSMTGFDLAREARRLRPGLVVVTMSGYSEDILSREADTGSTVAPLLKPFRAAELAAKVAEALAEGRGGPTGED